MVVITAVGDDYDNYYIAAAAPGGLVDGWMGGWMDVWMNR